MAWEWSHATEAYENARNNLAGLPLKDLHAIYGEWKTWDYIESLGDDDHLPHGWHDPTYERSLKDAKNLPIDVIVDYIWSRAEEQRTCDNGGFYAWLCPYGCGAHMVSFSREVRLLRTARKRGLCD